MRRVDIFNSVTIFSTRREHADLLRVTSTQGNRSFSGADDETEIPSTTYKLQLSVLAGDLD